MIDIQDKENVHVLEMETSGVLVNHEKPKKWMWRALVSRPAKINEYFELELSWPGQSTDSLGASGPSVHKEA